MQVSEKKMSYEVAGKKIDLTPTMVKNYLTRGNAKITMQEAVMFMNLCRYQELNPFLNEAYLVKYSDSKPAEKIVSKEAYMKRAENHPKYQGFQAGLIIERNGEVTEVEGSFQLKGDKLLGGWAKVYREDRKFPSIAKVNLIEYSTGKSTWSQKPATMIRKVAIVQAQREAFPSRLGALYTDVESGYDFEGDQTDIQDVIDDQANKGDKISFDDLEEKENHVKTDDGTKVIIEEPEF